MALNKKPTTGMKDILPEEMRIREYVQNVINDVKLISDEDFEKYVKKLIEFVTVNKVEFRYEEKKDIH